MLLWQSSQWKLSAAQRHLSSGRRVRICLPRNGSSTTPWEPLMANTYASDVLQRVDHCIIIIKASKFMWIDVGTAGSHSDAQVFNYFELKDAIDAGIIGFPNAAPLPGYMWGWNSDTDGWGLGLGLATFRKTHTTPSSWHDKM